MADQYTVDERTAAVRLFYETKSVTSTQRAFRTEHGLHSIADGPPRRTIRRIVDTFEREGNVQKKQKRKRSPLVRTAENITMLETVFARSPNKSVRRASAETGFSKSSVHHMLRQDLKLFPYKIQVLEALKETDKIQRLDFAEFMLQCLEEDPTWHKEIFFSDEAHFHLSGYVNKQNMRFWGSENPHEFTEAPLHPEKVTAWCAISACNVFGPFWFETNVNKDNYSRMIDQDFIPTLLNSGYELEECWFQQDGATPHCSNFTLNV